MSVWLLAPLAVGMGVPFPAGLQRITDAAPDLVPWAWAVNGCTSVLGAVLATLCAIHLGFRCLVLLAIGLYLVACVFLRGMMSQKG